MSSFWEYLQQHQIVLGFLIGLLAGLVFVGFVWKSAFTAQRTLRKELRSKEEEQRELQTHLNTHLKISAAGNETLQRQLDELKQQNETLRVNFATLQQKPGRQEIRHLQVVETAVRTLREQAPGFAPAWEKALREAEAEIDAAESGLKKLMRRVIPGLGTSTGKTEETEQP